jgi:hypothetical protein
MTPLTIATLIAQYGLPLAQQLFAMYQNGNKPVTAEDFAELVKLAQYRSSDSLAAAGLAIVDGKVVSLPKP